MDKGEEQIDWRVCPHPYLLAELGPRTSFIQSLGSFRHLFGSVAEPVAEPDSETIAAEILALQRFSAGPFHALLSAMLHSRESLRSQD